MISSALTHGERAKTFQQKKVTDLIDMMYKQQLIKSSQASIGTSQQNAETGSMNAATSRLNAIRQLNDSVREAPFDIPMTRDDFKSLDANTKSYMVYAMDAKQRGESVMPYNDFINQTSPPLLKQYYDLTKGKDGKDFEAFYDKNNKADSDGVEWRAATNNLEERFSKRDSNGMWAITPELQLGHDKAQAELVKLKKAGVDPLEAVNIANDVGRDIVKRVERNYFQVIKLANGDKSKIAQINNQFYSKYGYIPVQPQY